MTHPGRYWPGDQRRPNCEPPLTGPPGTATLQGQRAGAPRTPSSWWSPVLPPPAGRRAKPRCRLESWGGVCLGRGHPQEGRTTGPRPCEPAAGPLQGQAAAPRHAGVRPPVGAGCASRRKDTSPPVLPATGRRRVQVTIGDSGPGRHVGTPCARAGAREVRVTRRSGPLASRWGMELEPGR